MATVEYMTSQTYSATVGGVVYNVTASVGGQAPSTGLFVVTAYGADPTGLTDSTGAIETAIAASVGGMVVFPKGTYAVSDIGITTAGVTLDMRAGVTLSCSSTTVPILDINGADGVTILGGKLSGPGKATAASGMYGIALTDSSLCRVVGTEITGCYHGIRPDDNGTSEDNEFTSLYIHDCAHTGIFPKEGDTISLCRFKDIGTTALHHGMYLNTASDRGIRCIGNHYEGITGAGVHLNFSAALTFNGLTCDGETFDGCGWGYVLSTSHASAVIANVHIVGAIVNDCAVTTGDTGHGIHLITSAGVIGNCRIQAVIKDSAAHGLNADATGFSDCDFDIVATGCADHAVVVNGSNCTGRFVCHDNTLHGVYINGGTDNHFDITATANGQAGLYMTGAATDSFIKLYSSDNTQNGIYLGSSTANNRVVGVCQGNGFAQVNNAGTLNNLMGLSGSVVAMFVYAATPEAAVTAGIGSLCVDTVGGKLYVKASGTGNTGWVVAGTQT